MPEPIVLNDGAIIPQLGLGVWQVDPDVTARVVREAIDAGYRSIDTAEGYNNEEGVGEAVRNASVPRKELFESWEFAKRIRRRYRPGNRGADGARTQQIVQVHRPNLTVCCPS